MAQVISTSPEVKLDLTGQVQRLGEHYVAIGEHADFWLGEWRRGSTITKVGIKQLRGGSTTKPNFIENLREGLRRHGSVWLELNDDHISRFLGLAFDLGLGPMPALILEYHPNGNILHYAKQHPMSDEDKLHLITQVALGLRYLHERKPPIIHGDIRAANVLINNNGQAVLTDYGLAFIIESSDFTSIKTAGNCRWTAPEIMNPSDDDESVESSPPFTLASDIFAFAMFAVEVFTELPPFAKLKNDSAVIFAIISNKRPELPSYVAEKPALSDLLKRCWHQEPTQRPSAREVCDILSPYVREQTNIGSWLGSIFSAVRSLWFR
ncbi:hypothetical protein Hypma_011051 [Hypsizygus marmoreus]|uniref:Protein kinase domain-containing protein n=1 Tax=Hypsizygus marmoreus TaxID=39966 RepID=A0A369JI33_HYPMA|nr:hypothetical protein Hypma_011051 [Hypsizygus marmoreus]